MSPKLKLLLSLCLLHLANFASGQLITTNNLTVAQYVQDVLLGANVAVSNITFNGGAANVTSNAVGGFDCPDCNLGIPSGFAMCTGSVANMVGPNNMGSNGTGNGITGTPATYDADLYTLVQANGFTAMNDWAIIEFDFVPLGDTIQFVYV
ncbi:MAG: choice-of-anchor L domain-containing protein, partial [Flavobacteriales bacterium]